MSNSSNKKEELCPKCKIEMELVDSHYNLELEAEYGHPVEIRQTMGHCTDWEPKI